MLTPTFEQELLRERGISCVVGIDEVGRGPWAGPLLMCGFALSAADLADPIANVRDSKKLPAKTRMGIFKEINRRVAAKRQRLVVHGASAVAISREGLAASLHSTIRRIVAHFDPDTTLFLLDGSLSIADKRYKWTSIIKGDDNSYTIATAANYVKVMRDSYMQQLHTLYPSYGFLTNVGYGTVAHREALQVHGITPEHRTSYAPIAKYLNS